MKNILIKRVRLHACVSLLLIGGIAALIGSCAKTEQPETPKFLDVNIRFSPAQEPLPGDELNVALFYNKSVIGFGEDQQVAADEAIVVALTQEQIDGGLRVTFEPFNTDAEQAFVVAYVDRDGDQAFSPGDLAVFHNDKPYAAVVAGEVEPDNVIGEYAITINLNQVIAEENQHTPLTDIEGNVYATVTIGGQEWMAENLKVTKYNNSDEIATGVSASDWADASAGAYAVYPFAEIDGLSSEAEVVAQYGLLYNWYAVNDARGICPEGWRVATDQDWKEMETFLGMDAGDLDLTIWRGTQGPMLKSVDGGWVPDATNYGTDDYGFSAVPGGARQASGSFTRIGTFAYFWTATQSTATTAFRRLLRNNYVMINRSAISKNEGSCIRCLKIQ